MEEGYWRLHSTGLAWLKKGPQRKRSADFWIDVLTPGIEIRKRIWYDKKKGGEAG
ncbi:MAG: hypothetical protein HFF50_03800 [Lawsonibacter sp.]|nr:hypothetical protein [Lawsonibacter sp.]